MDRLKLQFLFAYAVNGCLVPFTPLYLRQMDFTDVQVGNVMALAGLAVILSPVIVTLIADAHVEARRVMAALLLMVAATLLLIPTLSGFWAVMAGFLLLNIVHVPVLPLQDGISFALQRKQEQLGRRATPYHKIRVWGTIGFLVPGLLLYLLIQKWTDITAVLFVAAAFAFLGSANAIFLPHLERDQSVLQKKLPTAEAGRVLFGRKTIVFCVACFLLQMAATAYYTFYPLYLPAEAGIPREWAGMIMNIGVLIEIVFMLSFARILNFLGPRGLLLAGSSVMAIRLTLLAAFTHPAVAIGIQAMHGMMVLVLHIGPIVLIDRLAEDRFRHSMQGLFAMVVLGGGRILGNLMIGPIARHGGYQTAFWFAAALTTVAFVLLLIGYHPAAAGKAPVALAGAAAAAESEAAPDAES